MKRVVLVTGATGGIGMGTSLELARDGYSVHVLGRSRPRGEHVVDQLRTIAPDAEHKLFLVDLSTIAANKAFLDEYIASYPMLDLLLLNANAYAKQVTTTLDGIETNFAVDYLSRYLFSVKLNRLMERADQPRVIHIGEAKPLGSIKYDLLRHPNYGIARATLQSYAGSTLLAHFLNKRTAIRAAHEIVSPGVVNTKQLRDQPFYFRVAARVLGQIEPAESGRRIVKHLRETDPSGTAGKFYKLEREKKLSRKLLRSDFAYERLIQFSELTTGVLLSEHLPHQSTALNNCGLEMIALVSGVGVPGTGVEDLSGRRREAGLGDPRPRLSRFVVSW